MNFSLWLEFEQYDGQQTEEPGNDFCNIQIELHTGELYAINVWSFEYMRSILDEQTYIVPPDLLVQRLNRKCITEAVEHYLQDGQFP